VLGETVVGFLLMYLVVAVIFAIWGDGEGDKDE
jgi:hypothetical protein